MCVEYNKNIKREGINDAFLIVVFIKRKKEKLSIFYEIGLCMYMQQSNNKNKTDLQ